MHCQSCGHESRERASFYERCGSHLPLACPGCGAQLRPSARFCDGCGHSLAEPAKPAPATDPRSYTPPHLAEKILDDRATLEGERRTVTALFADAIGFTPISERLDEEEVYDLMQGCLGRMMDAVHRYEGTITQFRGDGVMALFGAPIAHEDAARRAVAAALEIAKEIGNPPQLWNTHAALVDLRQAQGKPNSSRTAYRDALAVIEGVAEGLEDDSLRETFLNSPQVQTIRQRAGNAA